MRNDANKPLVLYSEGWESLPDGRQRLLVRCESAGDYAALPKELHFGKIDCFKAGWDSGREVAFYAERDGDGDQMAT